MYEYDFLYEKKKSEFPGQSVRIKILIVGKKFQRVAMEGWEDKY